jgi:hypothetical protein
MVLRESLSLMFRTFPRGSDTWTSLYEFELKDKWKGGYGVFTLGGL